MSNARNLANLLGTGTTIATAKIADDAITAAKIDDDGTGFTVGDLTVGNITSTGVTTGFLSPDSITLDGSSAATVTVNSAVSASATVVVDGVSGTIAVGMVVNVSDTTVRSITDAASQSAISVDDTLTITAVASQTSFTVSEAVTIAGNVVLILRADESSKMVLDASAASTDVGDEILFEDATSDGSILLDTAAAGTIVQVKNVMDFNKVNGSTVMPEDDTIPQNDEGVEFLTLDITPTSATNKLKIEVHGFWNTQAQNWATMALFQDSTANALNAVTIIEIGSVNATVLTGTSLVHFMDAGTTSTTTFKVRVGSKAAGNVTMNGVNDVRKFGGVMGSGITITEIAV